METLYSIGQVSKIKDISIKALRYYHKEEILIPNYIDPKTGYRFYTLDQFIYIDIIKTCRFLGSSIDEIKEIFKESNTNILLNYLKTKRNEAKDNILKLEKIVTDIDKFSHTIECSKIISNNLDIAVSEFPERNIIKYPFEEANNLKEILYYSKLEKLASTLNITLTTERGILYEIDSMGSYSPKYVFSGYITPSNSIKKNNFFDKIPAGNYITLSYSKENEFEQIKKLIDYAYEKQLIFSDFMEIELYNDLFNTENYSCQLQLKVTE